MHDLLGWKRKQLLEDALRLPGHAPFRLRLLAILPPPRLADNARYWLTRIAACPRLSAFVRAHDIAHWWQLAIIARFFTETQVDALRKVVFEAEGYETAVQKILQCKQLLRDTLRLGALLRIGNAHTHARKCDNMQALLRLHDTWVHRAMLLRVDFDSAPFPSPPLRGTKDIIPLCNIAELSTEGTAMHHCVASYAPAIRAGNTYIYRIVFPERATLEVRKNYAGIWKLQQIKGPYNGNISRDSIKAVEHWLHDAQRVMCSHLAERVVIGL